MVIWTYVVAKTSKTMSSTIIAQVLSNFLQPIGAAMSSFFWSMPPHSYHSYNNNTCSQLCYGSGQNHNRDNNLKPW